MPESQATGYLTRVHQVKLEMNLQSFDQKKTHLKKKSKMKMGF